MQFSPDFQPSACSGSGQLLGRMFAIAARQMGYRVHTFSPDTDTPTGQVADKEFAGSYDDLGAVRDFARGVSVVTFEFENVPAATAQAAAESRTGSPPAGTSSTSPSIASGRRRSFCNTGFP